MWFLPLFIHFTSVNAAWDSDEIHLNVTETFPPAWRKLKTTWNHQREIVWPGGSRNGVLRRRNQGISKGKFDYPRGNAGLVVKGPRHAGDGNRFFGTLSALNNFGDAALLKFPKEWGKLITGRKRGTGKPKDPEGTSWRKCSTDRKDTSFTPGQFEDCRGDAPVYGYTPGKFQKKMAHKDIKGHSLGMDLSFVALSNYFLYGVKMDGTEYFRRIGDKYPYDKEKWKKMGKSDIVNLAVNNAGTICAVTSKYKLKCRTLTSGWKALAGPAGQKMRTVAINDKFMVVSTQDFQVYFGSLGGASWKKLPSRPGDFNKKKEVIKWWKGQQKKLIKTPDKDNMMPGQANLVLVHFDQRGIYHGAGSLVPRYYSKSNSNMVHRSQQYKKCLTNDPSKWGGKRWFGYGIRPNPKKKWRVEAPANCAGPCSYTAEGGLGRLFPKGTCIAARRCRGKKNGCDHKQKYWKKKKGTRRLVFAGMWKSRDLFEYQGFMGWHQVTINGYNNVCAVSLGYAGGLGPLYCMTGPKFPESGWAFIPTRAQSWGTWHAQSNRYFLSNHVFHYKMSGIWRGSYPMLTGEEYKKAVAANKKRPKATGLIMPKPSPAPTKKLSKKVLTRLVTKVIDKTVGKKPSQRVVRKVVLKILRRKPTTQVVTRIITQVIGVKPKGRVVRRVIRRVIRRKPVGPGKWMWIPHKGGPHQGLLPNEGPWSWPLVPGNSKMSWPKSRPRTPTQMYNNIFRDVLYRQQLREILYRDRFQRVRNRRDIRGMTFRKRLRDLFHSQPNRKCARR